MSISAVCRIYENEINEYYYYYNAIAFQEVPNSQTKVSMGVWFYWAVFRGSTGISCA